MDAPTKEQLKAPRTNRPHHRELKLKIEWRERNQRRVRIPEFKYSGIPEFRNLAESEIGAQEPEVEEPPFGSGARLFRPEALFHVEFEVAAEPKALSPQDLRNSVQKYGSFTASARALGVSEAFVRQNAQEKKYSNRRGVK